MPADNWGFTPETYTIYGDLFIKDRAQIAKSLNKPLIMEVSQMWSQTNKYVYVDV